MRKQGKREERGVEMGGGNGEEGVGKEVTP
jgi:hypothetical protein